MLRSNQQLTEVELNQLSCLSVLCQEVDGGTPLLYEHLLSQARSSQCNLLYFDNEQLIGFLSIYFFYSDACEVSVLIAPNHRRQGLATRLIQTILPLLKAKKMKQLIFSTAASGQEAWMKKLGFTYKNSEYQMQRQSYEPILTAREALVITKATEENIPTLCAIDEVCFGTQINMIARFQNLLNDSDYTILIAKLNGEIIGKAHIRWQPKGAHFSDIAVLPEYQAQGFGGQILSYCINQGLAQGKVKQSLDVETSNSQALNLYTRHGFKIIKKYDFWAIALDSLLTAKLPSLL